MPDIDWAHSANDGGIWQSVEAHLKGTAALCAGYLRGLGCESAGRLLGEFHDFGKYSERFQEVLHGREFRVDHAFPSAAFLWYVYYKAKACPEEARILATVIASHHGQIVPFCEKTAKDCLTGKGDGFDPSGYRYSLKGESEFREAAGKFKKEIPLCLPRSIRIPYHGEGEAAAGICGPEDDRADLAKMLCVRMLLSALADADYADTAAHFGASVPADGPLLDPAAALVRLEALREEKRRLSGASPELNRLRDSLFEDCLAAGEAQTGLFTLTAPTGLGKTLALLAFALRHCERNRDLRRILLILPYLAVARQNVLDYRRVFPDLAECHSAAEWTDDTSPLAERWSSNCIVATNVGFFEPLFAGRAANLSCIHRIANSVIVLDEAQSLPAKLIDSTLTVVELLCRHYGCTFVFSTATQPAFSCREKLKRTWAPAEIVPEPQKLFDQTRRVAFEWRTESVVPFSEIAVEAAAEPACCVIVNLRRHASKLYDALLACRNGNEEEVYLLSTDLCQTHRQHVIDTVKTRLREAKPVFLISTQCIEAGVDIDFPAVYRALAPLEAVIQAAGRANRNGTGRRGRVVVFIPDEPKPLYPSENYEQAANCVLTLLSRHPVDCFCLAHVREYYELFYRWCGSDDKKLWEAIRNNDYQAAADAYKIIESKGVQVVVPWIGDAQSMELYRKVRDRYDREGLTAALMREARGITVNSFDTQWVTSCCVPMKFRSWERGALEAGWYLLGDSRLYDEKKGFACAADSAMPYI